MSCYRSYSRWYLNSWIQTTSEGGGYKHIELNIEAFNILRLHYYNIVEIWRGMSQGCAVYDTIKNITLLMDMKIPRHLKTVIQPTSHDLPSRNLDVYEENTTKKWGCIKEPLNRTKQSN